MAFRQIKSPALANQAVINTKLDVSAISGHSAKTSTALSGTFLLLDTDTNSLAKITAGSLIGSFTTNNLVEGTGESANLYFTPERAQLAVAADISDAVAAEAALRVAADNTLTTAINNEVTARTNADATLQSNITAEETARIAADSAEAIARASADLNLQNQIDFITANVDEEALDSLAEIVAAYQAADNAFTAAISANAAAISTETTNRVNADNTLQANIDAEVTARTNADATLQSNITAETNARTSADSTLTVNLAAEVTRATGVEAGLNTRLTTAEGDISTLETDLATEITRATSAEAANATNITAEQTARTNADAALQAELDATQTGSGLSTSGAYSAIGVYDAETNATGGHYIGGATSLANADKLLDSALKAVDTAYKAADATLTANLATEVTSRTNADTTLQANIDAEATTRIAGDAATLTSANSYADGIVATETAARIAAISAEHQHHIDGDAATLTSANAYTDTREVAITAAYEAYADQAEVDAKAYTDTSVAAEASLRTAADGVLQTNITNEATTRATADTNLQNAINAEATTRASADTALDGRLTVVETEMTATQSGAGLNANGTYTAIGAFDAETNTAGGYYIATATSLKDADKKLDTALKAEEEARIAGDDANATAISNEVLRAENAEGALSAAITAEQSTRASADTALSTSISLVSGDLAQELIDRAAADTNLQNQIDFIVSNVDAEALDSLTEIVAAFQAADGSILSTVNSNTTAINDEVTRATAAEGVLQTNITAEQTARIAADNTLTSTVSALDTAYKAADVTLQTNIDGKVAKSGDTMSGVLNMGSNVITGLANPSVDADAVNLGYLNTALSAYDLSNFTTDDLAEGTKKYFSNELARAAFSASGNLSYNSATGVFSVDTSKALLGLTDYVGVETDYTAMNGYVLVVKADGSGVELVDPTTLSFAQSNRQVINGDGAQTAFALTFTTTQANAMVFVGGVIQDPDTHYAIASNTITFVEALPVGTQAVVIANQTTAVPVLTAGQVTSDNLAADIKPFIKGSAVSAGTGGAVVDSFDGSVYRTAKFIIQVDNGAGEYESREALVTHNGTSAFITEYAIVYTGAGLLGDASVQMNGSTVELVYSAASGTASVTVTGTYL